MHSFLVLGFFLFASVIAAIDFYSCSPHGDILDITLNRIKPDPPQIGKTLKIEVITLNYQNIRVYLT